VHLTPVLLSDMLIIVYFVPPRKAIAKVPDLRPMPVIP